MCKLGGMLEKDVDLLYIQMLIEKRIKEHDVVYVFDEVGCGKTVSAIIAMASIIKEKNEKGEGYKILVVTPKAVCAQFYNEITSKLSIRKENVLNLANIKKNGLSSEIASIKTRAEIIVVSNAEKAIKLSLIGKYDLVVIDEAHDIVCNNQKQTELYNDNRIDELYDKICSEPAIAEKLVKEINVKNKFIRKFSKHLIIDEVLKNSNIIFPFSRIKSTKKFSDLCYLKSSKLIFLTATPYKYNKELDFLYYGAMAYCIVQNHSFTECMPKLDWIHSFYSDNINSETLAAMEDSNTSFSFKEVMNSIKYNNEKEDNDEKERIVEVWNGMEDNELLKNEIFERTKVYAEDDRKNRFIIFVSNSREGQYVFNKIFADPIFNILKNEQHYYKSATGITCEFVMNKFGNSYKLNNYSVENESIPDILIVTWQVAQVGVNLPTFNYVINYHIPSIPGYLEQRYGRIDRLKSKYKKLYNIYYLDNNPRAYIYGINLQLALDKYCSTIIDTPHNLPVKNLLFCSGLKFVEYDEESFCKVIANFIATYMVKNKLKIIKISDIIENDTDVEWYKKEISLYEVNGQYFLKIDDKFKAVKIYESDEKDSAIEDDTDISILEKIKTLITEKEYYYIVKRLNSYALRDEIKKAGTIILCNDNKKCTTITCSDIVKSIIECRQ